MNMRLFENETAFIFKWLLKHIFNGGILYIKKFDN